MRFVDQTMRWIVAVALCAGVAVAGYPAAAQADTAMRKAGRGLAAVTTGFLEIPGNMVMETQRNGPVYGTTLGFVKGLGGFVVREVVGVYELVTAPIEEPDDYQPLIEPEYPWGYFDEHHEVVADARFPRVADGL